jgi:hypothetical protein
VCVYEGFVKAPKEGWLHRTLDKKKRDFLQKGDRLIEKNAKKQGKKTRDFHSPRQTRF